MAVITMPEETDPTSPRQSLPVLPSSGKVEELKQQFSAAPAPTPPPAPPMHESGELTPAQRALESTVVEILRTVYDPEIPVNIYDLGLVYRIDIDAENHVKVTMTLTSPGCPVAGSLPGQVEQRIEAIPEVKSAEVDLVWDPPWDKSRLSESAMLDLGLI
jgi:FeS assembly SUF system protein